MFLSFLLSEHYATISHTQPHFLEAVAFHPISTVVVSLPIGGQQRKEGSDGGVTFLPTSTGQLEP